MSSHSPPPTKWVGVSPLGRRFEIVACAMYAVSCITVLLRLVARLQQFRRLFIDDYMSIAAQMFGFGMMIIGILLAEHYALGWHTAEVPPAQVMKYYQLFYAAETCYQLTSISYKLAIVFLYNRIFGEIRPFKIASWVMIGIVLSWGISQILVALFQCTPIALTWNPTLHGHCIDRPTFILGNGIANMIIDLTIMIMPLPMVWNLHLNWKKKLAVSGIFLLGAIVMIASVLRITTILPFDLTDGTYTLYGVALWSDIELPIGIIAACLPTLRQYFFSKGGGLSHSSSRWLSSRKSELNSRSQRADTAIALTGWKTNEAYAEVTSQQTSMHDKASSSDIEQQHSEKQVAVNHATFLDEATPSTSSEGESEDPTQEHLGEYPLKNTIHVSRQVSVRYDNV